jgi:hypothetical protein
MFLSRFAVDLLCSRNPKLQVVKLTLAVIVLVALHCEQMLFEVLVLFVHRNAHPLGTCR